MDKTELTIYNKKDVYEKEIKKKVEEIKRICAVNDIPFFVSLAIENTEKRTVYVTDGVFTGSANIELFDDKLTSYLMINRGAELAPLGHDTMFSETMDYIMDTSNEDE